jgi:GGDEF domain-containing protein
MCPAPWLADSVIDRAVDAIGEPIDVHGHWLGVGISWGMAHTDDPAAVPETLISAADAAMYVRKLRCRVA